MLSRSSTKTIEYCSEYYTIKVEIELKNYGKEYIKNQKDRLGIWQV